MDLTLIILFIFLPSSLRAGELTPEQVRTEIDESIRANDIDTVRDLLKAYGKEYSRGANHVGLPFTGLAAYTDRLDILQLLVEEGGDIGQVNAQGRNTLEDAVQAERAEIAEWLLERGAKPVLYDGTGEGGTTLMHVAAMVGNPKLIPVLAKHGRCGLKL